MAVKRREAGREAGGSHRTKGEAKSSQTPWEQAMWSAAAVMLGTISNRCGSGAEELEAQPRGHSSNWDPVQRPDELTIPVTKPVSNHITSQAFYFLLRTQSDSVTAWRAAVVSLLLETGVFRPLGLGCLLYSLRLHCYFQQ